MEQDDNHSILNNVNHIENKLKKLEKEKEKFHIHDCEFGSILISEKEVIFYVCSHC